MPRKPIEAPNFPIPARPFKQNWFTWILMGAMVGTPKTTIQSVVGGVALTASILWLIFSLCLWIALFLKQGIMGGLSALFGVFIWNILPYIIVHAWVNSLVIHRRRMSWISNPEKQAADTQAILEKVKNLPLELERSRQRGKWIGAGIVVIGLAAAITKGGVKENSLPDRNTDKNVRQFSQSPTVNVKRNPNVDYLDISAEDFYVFKPKSYSGDTAYGLIVYMAPGDECRLPVGWADVLEKRHLLFVAPQAAGNGTYESRRTGMGIMSALAMMQEYKIDPARVYVAGLSGGARAADMMAFFQPDLFKGTIQDCGSDFYKEVAHNHTTKWTDTLGKPYGVIKNVAPADAAAARKNVRFVLITGSKDFRRGNLMDLYENGYKPEGFQCELLDVPGMGQQDCNAETLNKALDFISEARSDKPAI